MSPNPPFQIELGWQTLRKLPSLGVWVLGVLLVLATVGNGAEDAPKADPPKPDAPVAKPAEPDTDQKKPALSPEEMFEGGTESYENWVELSLGGMTTRGNEAQAQERYRLQDGPFGGIQDLHYQKGIGENGILSVDGRALFDLNDYRLGVGYTQEGLGFLRFKFQEFRSWQNGDGGYYRPGDIYYPLQDDALTLDRGEISFEAGLRREDVPSVTFRYSHLYRDGQKGSTSWGAVHPEFSLPGGDPTLVRGLSPTFYDIDEKRDIFELDVAHRIKTTDVGVGLRYEAGELNNARKITEFISEPTQRRITNREGTEYDHVNVHAFSETWIKTNLFFSTGFLYSDYNADFSGSRIYGTDFDVGYVPGAANGLGYFDLEGSSQMKEYVLNLNLMAIPTRHLSIVPSIRVQKEDWSADSSGIGTLGTSQEPFSGANERDVLDVRERLDLQCTSVSNLVLYARGEWTQGDGNLAESGGLSQVNGVGPAPIQRETEDSRFFQKYSAGVRWYALRRTTLDVGGYYKDNDYEYDHLFDSTANSGGNRYPAYLVMQNFQTYDGNVRLTLRPWKNVTLLSLYEYQLSTIQTRPDSASGLAGIEASKMNTHIIGQNISWVPWSRLHLQAGFNYVLSETDTPASEVTQAVLDAQNNYWTLNFNAGLVLDDRTDLSLGYFHYSSDNFEDNSLAGLPLGAEAREHGVTATLVRRLTQNLRLTLRYGFYDHEDVTFGENRNYQSHVLFSTLQYRF
jgi:hypothetical protein